MGAQEASEQAIEGTVAAAPPGQRRCRASRAGQARRPHRTGPDQGPWLAGPRAHNRGAHPPGCVHIGGPVEGPGRHGGRQCWPGCRPLRLQQRGGVPGGKSSPAWPALPSRPASAGLWSGVLSGAGMGQRKIADALGVSQGTVSGDLRNINPDKSPGGRGRPRTRDPEQAKADRQFRADVARAQRGTAAQAEAVALRG